MQISDQRLAQQRDTLTSAIVSKADFLEYLRAHIKQKAGYFGKEITSPLKDRRDFGTLERDLTAGSGFSGVYLLTAIPAPAEITEKAVHFYFCDVMVKRLSQTLNALDWPGDAMPAVVRREQLENIKRETDELYRQRAELVAMLGEAGITGI